MICFKSSYGDAIHQWFIESVTKGVSKSNFFRDYVPIGVTSVGESVDNDFCKNILRWKHIAMFSRKYGSKLICFRITGT